MPPRDDNPALFRENVYKSWKIMAQLTRRIDGECDVVHSDTPEGVGYDNLVLVARNPDGSMVPQAVMNRNGVNSLTVPFIWKKCDEIGIEGVVEELLTACQAGKTPEPVESELSRRCDEVVSWIEGHHDEDFYVGPVQWWGSCRELLDLPEAKFPSDIWPFGRHGPEISLGIAGIETLRLNSENRMSEERRMTLKEISVTELNVSTPTSTEKSLVIQIARCKNIQNAASDRSHACHEVVNFQSNTPERHIPEAWFGNLRMAKVLFVSSNPSIDLSDSEVSENYPRSYWSDDDISEWVIRRTDQSWEKVPVTFQRPGFKDFLWRCVDDAYRGSGPSNSPQTTWNKTHRRVVELLGDKADPSKNYALTEVVHCKSTGEVGVKNAAPTCADKWLNQIVQLAANASVLVLCGSKVVDFWARDALQLSKDYGRGKRGGLDAKLRTERDVFVTTKFGRHQVVLYMGQPAYSHSLQNLYGRGVVQVLGRIAEGEIAVPQNTTQLQSLFLENS